MKKVICRIGVTLIILVIVIINFNKNKPVEILEEKNESNNLISMMIETGVDTNKYEASESNEWPGIFYEINKEKSGCENGGKLIYSNTSKKISMKNNVSDKCYVYFDRVTLNFANHIKSLFNGQGANNLYYHNAALANSANDNSYRFAGDKSKVTNNYVCFGSKTSPCPDENIYRILGVYNNSIKLMKEAPVGQDEGIFWDDNNGFVWEESSLNTYLNTTFADELGTWLYAYIIDTTWYSGEITVVNYASYDKTKDDFTAKKYYDLERAGTTNVASIGLINPSDVGFAATPEHWTKDLYYYYDVQNWIVATKRPTWTINPTTYTYYFSSTGTISGKYILVAWEASSKYSDINIGTPTAYYSAKPTFYLNTSVSIKDGDGTSDNPYILV